MSERDLLDRAVGSVAETATELAREIYSYAEIARKEARSSAACQRRLADAGFEVEAGEGELDTAFVARLDSGRPGPTVGILAEYDALPGQGHACGHNLIAGASAAAGLALAGVGPPRGSVVVYGCPAEETGFGKPAMLRAGWFEGLDAALSFHGGPFTCVMGSCKALVARSYVFSGRAAHAGNAPWEGRSALDAVIQTFNATNAARQFMLDGERLHGVVTEGGDAFNIVPERAVCRFGVRAAETQRANELLAWVDACADAAALATQTELRREDDMTMEHLRFHEGLATAMGDHLSALAVEHDPRKAIGASTEVGNVSAHVPTAVLYVQTWSQDTGFHTPEAAIESDEQPAYDGMLTGARVLARTAWDVLDDPASVGVDESPAVAA